MGPDDEAADGRRRMSEFFAMGGYGFYVWGSYGVTALCIAIEIWTLTR
jgi:heme exporter protein D